MFPQPPFVAKTTSSTLRQFPGESGRGGHAMLARDQLPEDAADWGEVRVELPRLPDNSPDCCPLSEEEVFQFVQTESADVDEADRSRLEFIRTALVSETQYWLWSYTESDGRHVFVTVQADTDGSTTLDLAEPNGLAAEQYLLAHYYDEVYWS
jgi:hypothetical protein